MLTAQLTPHGIAAELLDHIMSFVPPSSIPACTRVNSAFYLAAKPQVYREVCLDTYFHVVGANHALVDLDVGDRPFFRRAWMTRCTQVLDVAGHHESFCAAAGMNEHQHQHHTVSASDHDPTTATQWAKDDQSPASATSHHISSICSNHATPMPTLPPLPNVHTLRIPFDVHGSLAVNDAPSPCGLHTLPVRHLVHRDFYWTSAEPTTSSLPDGSLNAYTAFLDRREMAFQPSRHKDAMSHPSMLAPGALVTFVYPPPPLCVVPTPGPTGQYVYALHQLPPPPTHLLHPPPPPVAAIFPPSVLLSAHPDRPMFRSLVRSLSAYLAPCHNHGNCVHNLFVKLTIAISSCAAQRTGRVRLVGFEDLSTGGGMWVHSHLAFLTRALFAACGEDYAVAPPSANVGRRLQKWASADSRDKFLIVERRAWARSLAGLSATSPMEHRMLW